MKSSGKTMLWSTNIFVVGGIETYIYRMFHWAYKRNYRNVLILQEGQNIDESWRKQLLENDVEVYYCRVQDISSMPYNRDGELRFEPSERVVAFSTYLDKVINVMYLQVRFPRTIFKSYFYVLHPWGVRVRKNWSVEKVMYKWLMYKKLSDNNQMIFMDLECKRYFEDYYKLENHTMLAPLGMEIESIDENLFIERERNREKEFTILVIGRLQFPDKGYILDAVDIYSELKKKYPEVKLQIIGYGPGETILREKIELLNVEEQKDIKILGKISYNELKIYLSHASVLLGNGTTCLDGAGTGIPVCVAYGYQTQGRGIGFWHDDCLKLGAIYSPECEKDSIPSVMMIENIHNMCKEEYLEVEKMTYHLYKETYDMSRLVENIETLNVKNNWFANLVRLLLIKICRALIY